MPRRTAPNPPITTERRFNEQATPESDARVLAMLRRVADREIAAQDDAREQAEAQSRAAERAA